VSARWLPVLGYEGQYEVSDEGEVRSWLPYRGTPLPRSMALHLDSNGYPSVRLWDGVRQRHYRVHRLVTEAFIGPRPNGHQTRHLNGNPNDNRLSNLTYGTPSENNLDRTAHGTNPQSARTRCPQGHEYTPENTRTVRPQGRRPFRKCKTCDTRWHRERRTKQRAA
jgi:hypothetical protein